MFVILYIIAIMGVVWSIIWECKMTFPNLEWILKWQLAMDINFWVEAAEYSEILQERFVAREMLINYGAA